jgi:ATP-dependent DNA helicase RecQ
LKVITGNWTSWSWWFASETILFESYGDVIQLRASQGLNAEVQLAKLERMKQYADALSCRQENITVLFCELVTENCSNDIL